MVAECFRASFALSRMVRRRPGGWRCLLRSRLSRRRSSAAPCTRRRTGSVLAGAMRAPAGAIATGEAKDLYVFPLRRDAGSFAASCGVGVAGAAGRRRSCARFISGAFWRGAPHRLGAVRDFAGLRTGTVAAAHYDAEGAGAAWKNRDKPVSTVHRVLQNTDPGWIEDAARSRRSATRSTASASARIITRQFRWPVFDPQLSRRGDRCRPRRDGAGRLLTLDALHTTREADHRDPSRGLMVKGNAPSREHQLEDRQRYNEKPAHGRQRTIFTPLAKMIN